MVKRLLKSIAMAAILVGVLRGSDYLLYNDELPLKFTRICHDLCAIEFVLGIPPAMIWSVLSAFSILPELVGFHDYFYSNPRLWILFFLFYALVFYLLATLWSRYKARRNAKKNVQSTSAENVVTDVAPEEKC